MKLFQENQLLINPTAEHIHNLYNMKLEQNYNEDFWRDINLNTMQGLESKDRGEGMDLGKEEMKKGIEKWLKVETGKTVKTAEKHELYNALVKTVILLPEQTALLPILVR